MSLKCSVFGHDFGPTETVREREEDGNEVVTTIRETETCTRCGVTQIITENTEVTRIDADPAPAPTSDPAGEPPATAPSTDPAVESVTDGGGSATDPPNSASPDTATAAETEPDGLDTLSTLPATGRSDSQPEAGERTGANDDGVILDPADDDRPPGEWPEDTPAEESDHQASWPAAPTGSTDSPDGRAEDSPASPAPEDTADGADADALTEASETDPDPDPGPGPDPDIRPGPTDGVMTVPRGEFRCRECGHTEPVASSSLRAGDFCPACATGTLGHVADPS
jgi:hypothetical protein